MSKTNSIFSKPKTKEGIIGAIFTTLSVVLIFVLPVISLIFRTFNQDRAESSQTAFGFGPLIPLSIISGIIGIIYSLKAIKNNEKSLLIYIPLTLSCIVLFLLVLLFIAEITIIE